MRYCRRAVAQLAVQHLPLPFTQPSNLNQLIVIVDRNYGTAVISNIGYTHFSLLKSLEGAFLVPCLNRACDANMAVMSDMFGD